MAFSISLRVIVYDDIDEAVNWYEQQSKGLGKRFSLQVEIALTKIAITPYNYKIYHKNVRRVLLNRFPYKIFYTISPDNKILVLGIYHGKRSKSFIIKRLST